MRPTTAQSFDPLKPVGDEVTELVQSIRNGRIDDWKTAASVLADAVDELIYAVVRLAERQDQKKLKT